MTGSNKILTVSYGTFSCTLEGFDDPFGTMRGIAEYFRDLAADDRYFGAEPPTPDVEMLQNIAQKEVNRRVEARVGETGLALRQVEEAETAEDTLPEIAEPAPAAAAPEPEEIETAPEDAPGVDSGPLAFDDDYLMADEPEDVLTVDPGAPNAPAPNAPVESVAEKLRRIRAVVSRSIEPKEPTAPFETAPDAEGDAGAAPEPSRQRAQTRTIEEITADLADEDDLEEDFAEAPPLTLRDDAADTADTSLISSIMASSAESEQDEQDGDEAADNLFDEEATELAAEDADDDDFDAALAAAISRTSRDDRLDAPEVLAEAAPAEDEPDSEDDVVAAIEEETGDDIEDADFDDEFDDDEFDDDEPEDIQIAPAATSRRPSVPLEPLSEDNGAVGRLLQETAQKFNEDDGIRRRRVISQMRAAVAATKADRILSRIIPRDEQEAEDQNAYRQDLSRAMTRRPSFSEVARAEAAARQAPLVLVSSQRVDQVKNDDIPKPTTRPVGVSTDTSRDASSFREFAANMGATNLPDLLEAAAAYTAFVEGQPHFSRPEIMKRVARVDPALDVSREAGLRSFGQLLRQGKIHKLQRGQFTVPETTRFNPAQRYAGE